MNQSATQLKDAGFTAFELDADACEILAPALAYMEGLKTLYLGGNHIGDEGRKVMREAWEKMMKPEDGLVL